MVVQSPHRHIASARGRCPRTIVLATVGKGESRVVFRGQLNRHEKFIERLSRDSRHDLRKLSWSGT
jgi:hypothetical protein